MALFGTAHSFVGLDIGTSSLKIIELIYRKRRTEVATYAEANLANLLIAPPSSEDDALRETATVIQKMFEEAQVASDTIVAALPSSIVFSAVIYLPPLSDADLPGAVRFAARDIVPADLEDMVLGWKRVGELPHMEAKEEKLVATAAPTNSSAEAVPIFLTAAPREIVNRYTRLAEMLHLELIALEVETFPLIRSLLSSDKDSALICDIGDQVTTYHLIDAGTPVVSHTIEYGSQRIDTMLMETVKMSAAEAQSAKVTHGLLTTAPPEVQVAIKSATDKFMKEAERLLAIHAAKSQRHITKTILIGGGAKLQGLAEVWAQTTKQSVTVGNPWRGLAYPHELERRAQELGPAFAVAIGLAQRGFANV